MTALLRYRAPRLQLSWQMLIACMVNLLSLALPIMMLQVYDRIIPHQAYGTLALLIIGVVSALFLDTVLRSIRAYLASWTAVRYEHQAGCDAVDHLMNADMAAVDARDTGTHFQNMSALSRLREFYSGQAMMALIDLPFAALFLALIAYVGGWLVLVPLGLLAVFVLSALLAGDVLKKALQKRSEDDDKKSGFIVSILSSIHTVKAEAMEEQMLDRYTVYQNKSTQDSYRVALASGASTTLSSVFGQLALILTVTVGCFFVINGELTVGGLSACTLLAGRTIQPVQRVLGAWLRLQDVAVSRKQASELFDIPGTDRMAATLPQAQGKITLHHARYGSILNNISLDIQPGEIVSIKGEKGSGKTTLLQLMAGFFIPDSGHVMIDGFDASAYRPSDLVHHVGYMPQQGAIFKGTVLQNITGFRDDEHIITKAKEFANVLGLDQIIDQLPYGYQTALTDSPSDPIPPGVKQRVALLRVLINEPKIVLFDDADRTLDKDGYNRLFRLLGELKGHVTLVIASHDQNLVSLADRSFVLQGGRLMAEVENISQRVVYLNQMSTERSS